MDSSKDRKQKRILPSTLDHEPVLSDPLKSCQTSPPREPTKITAAFEDKVEALNPSATQWSPGDSKIEKPKRFIVFIGKPNCGAQ